MTSLPTSHPLLRNKNPKPHNRITNCISPNLVLFPFANSFSISLSIRSSKPSALHSSTPSNTCLTTLKHRFFTPETILLLAYALIFFCIRILFLLLPPDLPHRWHGLVVFSEEAEVRSRNYPSHLWQAVVAYEDRRFFQHCGVDPVGIARAVFLFPKGGGGSTITQQLVKNIFLKNDRTISRKVIEMVLALILERIMPKQKILSLYIYWGHGIYGIESASDFYFGKHPSLLSLGESAMLAGIIPAPELRSPFKDLSRGKTYQARALKRMVDAGFLDIGTALSIVDQPLHLHFYGPEQLNKLLDLWSLLGEELGESGKLRDWNSNVKEKQSEWKSRGTKDVWDWRGESKIWEVKEDMERWARTRKRS